MTIDLIVKNKIFKNNKVYLLPMKTIKKTITMMKITLLKIKMKTAVKLVYIIQMKTILVNISPQNLQFQHKMHH